MLRRDLDLEFPTTPRVAAVTLFWGSEHELIAFAVLELCVGTPRLLLGGTLKNHAALLEFGVCFCDIRAREYQWRKSADSIFLSFGRKEDDTGLCFGDAQFDPALFLIEWLIRDNGKAEFFRVKIKGAILVTDWDANEFDVSNHGGKVTPGFSRGRGESGTRE